MAVDSGLSSADLRQRAAAANLARKNGDAAAPSDAMDQIVSDARKRLAITTASKLASDSATEDIEAETRRLEAEAKRQQLREQVKGGGRDDEWQKFVVERLGVLEEANRQLSEQLSQAQMAALADQMNVLKTELARLQSQPVPSPVDPFDHFTETVTKARAVMELINPPALIPPPPMESHLDGPDPALTAWTLRATHEHERWVMAHADEVEIKKHKIDGELELKREELAIQKAHYERLDRFMEKTSPEAIKLLNIVAGHFFGGEGATAADARPEVAPPPGVLAMNCQTCGTRILYPEGSVMAVCSACGSVFKDSEAASPHADGNGSGQYPEDPE